METLTAAALKSMPLEKLEELNRALEAETRSVTVWVKADDGFERMAKVQPPRVAELQEQRSLVLNRIRATLAAATRERNAAKRAANAVTGFVVGQRVAFKAFGFTDREYAGTVVKVGRTGKVTVEYTLLNGKLKQKAVDATSGIRGI